MWMVMVGVVGVVVFFAVIMDTMMFRQGGDGDCKHQ